jgi:hypothetical protein
MSPEEAWALQSGDVILHANAELMMVLERAVHGMVFLTDGNRCTTVGIAHCRFVYRPTAEEAIADAGRLARIFEKARQMLAQEQAQQGRE